MKKKKSQPNGIDTYTKEQAFTEMVCWMYCEDGKYPNKNEFRAAFVRKLNITLRSIK